MTKFTYQQIFEFTSGNSCVVVLQETLEQADADQAATPIKILTDGNEIVDNVSDIIQFYLDEQEG
jgi:hypothetical protein